MSKRNGYYARIERGNEIGRMRNFVLNLRGIDSTREFIERQAKLMEEG